MSNWHKLAYEMTNTVCLSVLPPLKIVKHLTSFHEISYDPYDETRHVWKHVTVCVKNAITSHYSEFQEEIVWSSLRLCTRSLSKAVADFTAPLPLIASALTIHRSLDVTSCDTGLQVFFYLSKVLPEWVSVLEVTKTVRFFLPVQCTKQ
jgi:hypothetical protein